MHFLLPDLSLLSGITVCELKIACQQQTTASFVLGIVCIPRLLHVELLFVSVADLCKEFLLSIQWRISRWIADQRLSALLNAYGISQLSELNQTKPKNHAGKRMLNSQIEPMICWNNYAKSTS